MAAGAELAKAFVSVQLDQGQLRNSLSQSHGQFRSFFQNVKGLAASLGVGLSIAGIVQLGRTSIDLARRQIDAEQNVKSAIEATGAAAGFTAQELIDFAQKRQQVTRFGDEETLEAAAKLLTFRRVQRDVFLDTIKYAQDASTLKFGPVLSIVTQLGKALNDPSKNMSQLVRVGISFSQQQIDLARHLENTGRLAEAQAIILKELRKEFGGAAEKGALTLSGRLDQLNNLIGDQKELLGTELLPILVSWKETILGFHEGLITFVRGVKALNTDTGGLIETMGKATLVAGGLALAIGAISAAIKIAVPLLFSMDGAIGALTIGLTFLVTDIIKRSERLNRTLENTGNIAKKNVAPSLGDVMKNLKSTNDELETTKKNLTGITAVQDLAGKIQSALLEDDTGQDLKTDFPFSPIKGVPRIGMSGRMTERVLPAVSDASVRAGQMLNLGETDKRGGKYFPTFLDGGWPDEMRWRESLRDFVPGPPASAMARGLGELQRQEGPIQGVIREQMETNRHLVEIAAFIKRGAKTFVKNRDELFTTLPHAVPGMQWEIPKADQ